MIPLIIAVEDDLSEALTRKLVASIKRFDILLCLGRQGASYLEKNIAGFQKAARHQPYLVVTDLDRPNRCPATLCQTWLGRYPESHLLFRIAVMESESWLLAHRDAAVEHLKIDARKAKIPDNTDSLPDPKQFLINLARKSRSRRIRDELVPPVGSTSRVGPNYNANLVLFVRETWAPEIAARHSPSLRRTLHRLATFNFP